MAQNQFSWNPQSSKAWCYLENAGMKEAKKLFFKTVVLYIQHPGLSNIRRIVLSCLFINLQNLFFFWIDFDGFPVDPHLMNKNFLNAQWRNQSRCVVELTVD